MHSGKRSFAADPDIVGKPGLISGQPVTINGVAEEGFQGATS
jgi:hypothetical protein